ncbi:MAG: hypothetical protein JXR63_11760 [Spirochaetales bacterium]|nr:hypothetical protein [Spirochaetales bacterium]
MNKINKIIKVSLILTAFLNFNACDDDFEIPENPLTKLDTQEVIKPLNYLGNELSEASTLTFTCNLTEEIATTIKTYRWQILDVYGEEVLSSKEKNFTTKGKLKPEEYTVVLTIYDQNNNSRSFSKKFTIKAREISPDLTMRNLNAAQDTGKEDSDGITKINKELTFSGVSSPTTAVDLMITNLSADFTKNYEATTDGAGEFTITLPTDLTLEDGNYDVYFISNEASSNTVYLTIDTLPADVEWLNKDELPEIEYRDSIDIFKAIMTSEPVFEQTEESSVDTTKVGVQEIAITTTDIAGNKSEAIQRQVQILPPEGELVRDGGFENGSGSTISTSWMIGAEGYKDFVTGSDEWGGIMTSPTGGTLNYEGGKDFTLLETRTKNESKKLFFHPEQNNILALSLRRVRGYACQEIDVLAGVTYEATVETIYDNSVASNHHSWNALAVQSLNQALTFTEGNIRNYPYEPYLGTGQIDLDSGFNIEDYALICKRVCSGPNSDGRPADDTSEILAANSPYTLTIRFTPSQDGKVLIGVIKSDLWYGATAANGASFFDNLSVQPVDWPKVN